MGHNVTIRRNCNACGGSGKVWAPDPPRPPRPPKPPKRPKPRKRGNGDDIGVITIGEDGEIQEAPPPPTREQRERAAAATVAFATFLGVALIVSWQGTLWSTLGPPLLAAGTVYLVLRRFPRAAMPSVWLLVLGFAGVLAYVIASMFGLVGGNPTP
jgi:hypothetical protein